MKLKISALLALTTTTGAHADRIIRVENACPKLFSLKTASECTGETREKFGHGFVLTHNLSVILQGG
ncbi:hypothetical protein [Enterobacter cloacae]|uniref:hypothetical protein n=1 Tax=Enterobacter cloacae TaxID=550 RepID=UPI0013EFB6E6|nr:hypothetical protein [Enterobacter cloacae]